MHKTRVALFFNGARVFFLSRDQLLTHFFSRAIIFIIHIATFQGWYMSSNVEITVCYLDESFRPQTNTFRGYTAQIIQHECDHCEGILI